MLITLCTVGKFRTWTIQGVASVTPDILQRIWAEVDYIGLICTGLHSNVAHIETYRGINKTLLVSL